MATTRDWKSRYSIPGTIHSHSVPGGAKCEWCKLQTDSVSSTLQTFPEEGDHTFCRACGARGIVMADGINWHTPGDDDMKDRYAE